MILVDDTGTDSSAMMATKQIKPLIVFRRVSRESSFATVV